MFGIRKMHMGAVQASPAPSMCNSHTELCGEGGGPLGLRAGGGGHLHMGEKPEQGPGGSVGSQCREKAVEHEIGAQKSNSCTQNLRLARPVQ